MLPHHLRQMGAHDVPDAPAGITAVVKTQGSDTKLVGQMQPYYEAKGLSRWDLGGRQVPPLVTQIADGENGGVMMNEFPPKYLEVIRECSGSATPAVNVTEYLERLRPAGIGPGDLPVIQPLFLSQCVSPVARHPVWPRQMLPDSPLRLIPSRMFRPVLVTMPVTRTAGICRRSLRAPFPPLPNLEHHLDRALAQLLGVLPLCCHDSASSQGPEPPRFPGVPPVRHGTFASAVGRGTAARWR